MKDLRVPKKRVEVEVLLPGGGVHQVAVFLAEFASQHTGSERLSDLLNGEEDFFPAVDAASDDITFLNRQGIAVARVAQDVERDPASEFTLPSEFEVQITLVNGARLQGLLSFVMPPERSRLVDFLNEAPIFFRLLEQDRIALVNKHHVARVAQLRK